jgi:hypothetical protein
MIDINWNPSQRELRVFSALLLAFAGLLGYMSIAGESPRAAMTIWGVGLLLGGGGLLRPKAILIVYRVWMALAYPIGFVLSNLILGTVYYVVITLTGIVMRTIGWDPMARRIDKSATSYWVPHKPPASVSMYFKEY